MDTPGIYKKLIQDYNGKLLPATEAMMSNLLVTSYGMTKTSAETAARVFIKNAKNVNIIDGNNRLRFIMPTINNSVENLPSPQEELNTEDSNPTKKIAGFTNLTQDVPDASMFELPIDLGEKTAYLKYPRSITIEEIAILKIMLDAQLSALSARRKISEIKNGNE